MVTQVRMLLQGTFLQNVGPMGGRSSGHLLGPVWAV